MSNPEKWRNDAAANYEVQLAQRFAALSSSASSSGPPSQRRATLIAEHRVAEDLRGSVAASLNNRAANILVENAILFWSGSVFIFLIEAYLNKVVVDMAAQTAGGVSLLVAALVSITLVALAHWCGHLWRQIWSDSQDRILIGNVILGVVILIIVAGAVVVIMALRAYFALMTTTTNINVFSDAVQTLQQLGPEFVMRAFGVPESATLGGLNTLALLVAFLFGFFSHDSDHQYDKVIRKEKQTSASLEKQKARYEVDINNVFARFRRKIEMAQRSFVANGGKLSDLAPDNPAEARKRAEVSAEGAATPVSPDRTTPSSATHAPKAPDNITKLTTKTSSGNPW